MKIFLQFLRELKKHCPEYYEDLMKKARSYFITMALGTSLPYLFSSMSVTVEPGHKAIIVNSIFGPRNKVYSAGLHFVVPVLDTVHVFDVRSSAFTVERTFSCLDAKVKICLRVLIHPEQDGLADLFRNFGLHYRETVFPIILYASCSSVISNYAINELLANVEDFRTILQYQLAKEAKRAYIILDDLAITEVTAVTDEGGGMVSCLSMASVPMPGVAPGISHLTAPPTQPFVPLRGLPGARLSAPLKHIIVDKNAEGSVYWISENIQSASNAQRALRGRYFAGHMISSTYILRQGYETKFPDSR